MIAAPRSGSGKTTVTLGLLRALRQAGVAVASAKCGPDYIDPPFHRAASGRPSVNLEFLGDAARTCWDLWRPGVGFGCDLIICEALMGLFDGVPGAVRAHRLLGGRRRGAWVAGTAGAGCKRAVAIGRRDRQRLCDLRPPHHDRRCRPEPHRQSTSCATCHRRNRGARHSGRRQPAPFRYHLAARTPSRLGAGR